jgi:outer membrane lipoprotein-sorting protein
MNTLTRLVALGLCCGSAFSCSLSEGERRSEAEETLKKIEDNFLRTKSFRLNYSLAIHSPRAALPGETRESGVLTVKQGGKIHCRGRMEWVGEKVVFLVVSDGQTWKMQGGPSIQDGGSKDAADKDLVLARESGTLRNFLMKSFVHVRLPDSVELKLLFTRGTHSIVVPPVSLKDIRTGSDAEGSFVVCDYLPTAPGLALAPYRIKLWYDPRSFAPRKRVVTLNTGDPAIDHPRSTERFEDLEVNIDVPDEQFRLPS